MVDPPTNGIIYLFWFESVIPFEFTACCRELRLPAFYPLLKPTLLRSGRQRRRDKDTLRDIIVILRIPTLKIVFDAVLCIPKPL
ncbi:hypothetical protein NW764_16680 [Fusarium oxysporum]|nr:hypothetical protein NW758_15339 [Fusarium oxysporum]KAJ4254289.1 hypothetical protein NW764_16680 [Fusarium oxysporum]